MTDPPALSMFTFLGLGCVDYPFLLPDLRDELEADERAIDRLDACDDEATIAALRARAERIRAAIAEISGYLDLRAETFRAVEADRLLEIATRPGNSRAVTDLMLPLIEAAEKPLRPV